MKVPARDLLRTANVSLSHKDPRRAAAKSKSPVVLVTMICGALFRNDPNGSGFYPGINR